MKLMKLGVVLATCLLAPVTQAAEEIILKFSHFLPPISAAQVNVFEPWCEKIATESQGRMKCQIYPSMQLGGTPPQLLNQVKDGVVDITWILPGYNPGRFPVSEVFELPFITSTHEASSRALWDFMQKHSAKELAGIKPLATWVNGPNALHLRDKKVETLADLKGLKVRAPSRLSNKLLAALGATPVGMPVPQMAESLSKGVINGALVPWEVVPATKAQEFTKYHADFGGDKTMITTTMILAMNQKKYDSLPDDLKKVIDNNSGADTSVWVAARFKEADIKGREVTEKQGNTIYTISAEEMEQWKKAAQPVIEGWIEELSAKGVDAKQLYQEAVDLVGQYSKQ
ncbi:TRAP transporter substrate-binding protein [Thiofilum flexile]|uniref:TRAP transporter substrate-binding protein n=1 Tax=Thiofilum flexile TaxID=125627 RepID=UPI0003602BEC|nr:TRAP transporter substrate-binding protein [Thiofilum flexile]